MKKIVLLLSAILGSSSAFAVGFNCETQDKQYLIQTYHDGSLETDAVMFLSSKGKRIATFSSKKKSLDVSKGQWSPLFSYIGDVDLRKTGTSNSETKIAGIRLRDLDTIILRLRTNHPDNLDAGEKVRSTLELNKRNRQEVSLPAICYPILTTVR